MKQVEVIANTFTYKNVKYNKGAVIEVDGIEHARLIGSYPFSLQTPLDQSKPIINTVIPEEPIVNPNPAGPISLADLKGGGGKKDDPEKTVEKNEAITPEGKSDDELLNKMGMRELRELAKGLKITVPLHPTKKIIIDLLLEK